VTNSLNETLHMADTPQVPDEHQPIVIADADEDNACHVERQLRRAGVKNPIVMFQDGDRLHTYFADEAQKGHPGPCVLFLNPRMPGANGYDPVRWAKREKCGDGLLVAIFSTPDEPDEVESANELGVTLFLKKHPDLSSLSLIVEHLGGALPDASVAPQNGVRDATAPTALT
jgi:CheY-like chemotaxis protein